MSSAERRVVLYVSLTAAALVVTHSVLWDVARWNGDELTADMADLVTIGGAKANVFRFSLLADAFGSYLLTLPASLALWRFLRTRYDDSLVDLLALAGLLYAFAGAVAAVTWADGGAALIRDYDATQSAAVATQFATMARAATATWQIVCVVAGGAWWLGSGLMLRTRWKWFGRYSIAFGALSLLLGLMRVAGVEFNSSGPATVAFLPIAIWIGWLGLSLAKSDR